MFSTVDQLTVRRYTSKNDNAKVQEVITLPIIDIAAYLMQHFTDKNMKFELTSGDLFIKITMQYNLSNKVSSAAFYYHGCYGYVDNVSHEFDLPDNVTLLLTVTYLISTLQVELYKRG